MEEFATALSSKGSHWKKKKDFLDFFYSADNTLFASFVVSMTFCNVKNKQGRNSMCFHRTLPLSGFPCQAPELRCLRGCFFRSCTARAVAFAFFALLKRFFLKDGKGWKPSHEPGGAALLGRRVRCWAEPAVPGEAAGKAPAVGLQLTQGCCCSIFSASFIRFTQINSAWQSTRIQLAAWPSSAGRLSSEPWPRCRRCRLQCRAQT